jgi:cell division protease FtsH
VRGIIERAHDLAMRLLRDNMDKLHLLANALLDRETIDGSQMDRLLKGEKLEPVVRPTYPADTPPTATAPATSAEDRGTGGGFGEPSPRPA